MSDDPYDFVMPRRAEDVPREVRREVARQLLDAALQLYGWPKLLKHLYVGREDIGIRGAARFQAAPQTFYPFLLADAAKLHPSPWEGALSDDNV